MNIQKINQDSHNLVKLLYIKDFIGDDILFHTEKKMNGQPESTKIFHLSESTDVIIYNHDILENIIAVRTIIYGKEIGLKQENYHYLKVIVEELLLDQFICENSDFKFLEVKTFKWLVSIYLEKEIENDLYKFILSKLEEEKSEYSFYFKLNDLIIEDHFVVGNCELTSIDQTFFEKRLEETNSYNERISQDNNKAFYSFFNRFCNRVLITITVNAIKDKAILLAKKEVELSINALKMFLSVESITKKNLFDIDFIIHDEISEYFSFSKTTKSFDTIIDVGNHIPVKIDNQKLNELNSYGLKVVSLFLQNKKNSELYFEIESLINELGNINSTKGFHDRIVLLVSFFERIIIPKTNVKGKGLAFLKNNVLPKLISNFNDEVASQINKIYNIRDKYIHNRIEIPIDVDSLLMFKDIARIFILKLINLNNSNYESLEDVQNYFKIQILKK